MIVKGKKYASACIAAVGMFSSWTRHPPFVRKYLILVSASKVSIPHNTCPAKASVTSPRLTERARWILPPLCTAPKLVSRPLDPLRTRDCIQPSSGWTARPPHAAWSSMRRSSCPSPLGRCRPWARLGSRALRPILMSRLVGAFLPIAKGVALGSVTAVEARLL